MKPSKWISAWASVIGSSHIAEELPCQDNCRVEYFWGTEFVVAALSDGAGSCSHSDIGSKVLIDGAIERLTSLIKLRGWDVEPKLTKEIWRLESQNIFKELRDVLLQKADELAVDFKSLSATLMTVISNGDFIACANIGDGRGAYRDNDSKWHPIIVPTKGEEANQTLFVTSDLWIQDNEAFFCSYFQETEVTAFTILSDGCERASFEILKYDEESSMYFDPNKPYEPFFEPNLNTLIRLNNMGKAQDEVNELWRSFLQNGNAKLIAETDDKSMVLSVKIPD